MVPLRHYPPGASVAVLRPLAISGLMIGALFLILDFQGKWQGRSSSAPLASEAGCETIVQADARLGREQLAQLLTIPERGSRDQVRDVIAEPYCLLPELNVRSGVVAEREAYPLAFDPSTRLVILYENDEYAGYRFSFE